MLAGYAHGDATEDRHVMPLPGTFLCEGQFQTKPVLEVSKVHRFS